MRTTPVRLLGALLLFKCLYFSALYGAVWFWPADQDAPMYPGARQEYTPDGYLTFASHLGSWDAEHYLFIAAHGYEAGAGRCAFYPLWPYLVRGFSVLLGGNQVLAGALLANLFSLAGFLLFFKLAEKRLGASTAVLALGLLVLFPGSLFFQFIYSESLFFFLLVLLCFSLERNALTLAAIAGFLLPLTRAVGFISLVPIATHLLSQIPPGAWPRFLREDPFGKTLLGPGSPTPRRHLWLLLAPVLGWSSYLLLMWIWTGNAFEGFHAQKQFGVQAMDKLLDLPQFVVELFSPTAWHDFTGSFLDRAVFAVLLACLPIIWKLSRTWFLLTLVLGIIPAVTGTFTSYTRFASVVFPLFIAMAVFLDKPKLTWLRWPVLSGFAVVHGALLWKFVYFRWAA